MFNQPTTTGTRSLPPGDGYTDTFGNITYSTAGTLEQQQLVLFHEQVHAFLSPKLNLLREQRANLGMAAYDRSHLLRYLEEALAEGYAQLRVRGFKGLPDAIRFPLNGAYRLNISRIVGEGLIGTVAVGGTAYAVHVVAESNASEETEAADEP